MSDDDILDQAREEMERLRRGNPDMEGYLGSREAMAELPGPRVTFESVAPQTVGADIAKQVVSITFMSRSDNARPHVVTRRWDDTLICTCQANPAVGCWASKAFKQITGMQ